MGLLGDGDNSATIDAVAFLDSGIPKLVGELVSMGLLCAVGSTRDRGAISIQITHNGEWDREYFRRSDEAEEWLRHAVEVLRGRGLGAPVQDPPRTQTPRRGRQRLS
jgi:hypothetical protein